MIKFTIHNRKNGRKEAIKAEGDSIVIGRLLTNQIVLDSKTVSRKHAEIVRTGDEYFIIDLESGNGTYVNGKKLKPFEKSPLHAEDAVRIEEFEIKGHFPKPHNVEENTDSGILEIKMLKKVLTALDTDQHPTLEVLSAPAEGKRVSLTDDISELTIGRDPDCGLSIDSTLLSRQHAIVQKKWGGITIRDLGSKNGTFINNQKIEEKLLNDGDEILLGTIKILFRNPQEIDMEAISKEYENRAASQAEEEELESTSPQPPETPSPSEPSPQPEAAAASEQAKASLEELKPEVPKAPPLEKPATEVKTIPTPGKLGPVIDYTKMIVSRAQALIDFARSRLSPTELIILGVGISAILLAVVFLFIVVF